MSTLNPYAKAVVSARVISRSRSTRCHLRQIQKPQVLI